MRGTGTRPATARSPPKQPQQSQGCLGGLGAVEQLGEELALGLHEA